MKAYPQKAFNELQALGCPVIPVKDHDAFFLVSGEDASSYEWCDYYGEYRGGYPWVSDTLTEVLDKYGLTYEWENPGCLGIY